MLALCVLLSFRSAAGHAQYDTEKLIRERAKTLATDRDVEDRVDAARFLGGFDKPEAVAALAKALSDQDASVREAAASALWKTGKGALAAKPELQKALGDPSAAVVARAAGALSYMGVKDEELAPAWRRALDGATDDSTSFMAARGLIGIDLPVKLAPPILAYLSRNAETAANPRRGRTSLDDTKSAESAAKALERLLKQDPAPILPLLSDCVEAHPNSGRYVFDALGTLKVLPPGTLDLALSQTGSSIAKTRYAAISLAGKVTAEPEAARWIPEAIRLLGDPDESVRTEACWVLKGVRGLAHGAAPELTRLLSKDPSMSVRKSAASALEAIGDASNPIPSAAKAAVASVAKASLVIAMNGKDKDLAVEAVGAYNVLQLGSAEIVATLAEVAVSGADTSARQRALLFLRNRQGQAKSIVATIRPLATSSDKLLAEDARTAIEWIERGGAGSPGAIGSAAAAAPAPAASVSSAAAPPVPAGEESGLAVLRERKLEFNATGFYSALSTADAEAIRAYLDGGMSPKLAFAESNHRSPLMVLFFHGKACAEPETGHAIVALLLARGADVNQLDENRNSALIFAADKCDRQTIRLLLKAGAKLDHRNGSGLNALEMGIVSGNAGVEELIAAGARMEAGKAKAYAEAYKSNPKVLALLKKASAK
jgi:hypothetical protein